MGNETLLARLVANVVNNAVRHNVADGMVVISNGMRDAMAYLVSTAVDRSWTSGRCRTWPSPSAGWGRAGGR